MNIQIALHMKVKKKKIENVARTKIMNICDCKLSDVIIASMYAIRAQHI